MIYFGKRKHHLRHVTVSRLHFYTKNNTFEEVKAIQERIQSLVSIEIVINNIFVPMICTLVVVTVDSKVRVGYRFIINYNT